MNLYDKIENINNVGEQRAGKLRQLNIDTVKDMLEYFPRDYEDRSTLKKISELQEEEENTFVGKVLKAGETAKFGKRIITKVAFKDETGVITAVWYNQGYLKNSFSVGEEYLLTGKVIMKYGRLEISAPEYEKIDGKELLSGGRIVPVYSSTYKLSQKMLRQLIKNVIEDTYDQLEEFLPLNLRKEHKLADRNFAIQNIHFPSSEGNFFIARRRLVFEELFLLQLGLLRIKGLNIQDKQGIVLKNTEEEKELLNILPFKLTNAQAKALDEIKQDFVSGKPMNRLVQGDVGSGKTVVAMLAAFTAVKNGYQVSMMVPTEVLAKQHFEEFTKYLEGFGIKTALLVGSMTKKQKMLVQNALAEGEIDIVLGTHALIQEDVNFKKLGLVITDEQHRFGVKQRASLVQKGENPHTLVMTATPIPRTLALILYGDLDITIIDELPPGRQKIDTFYVNTSYRERFYEFIRKEINKGRQAYIICPMVEGNEKQELQAVIDYTEKLQQDIFKEFNVEYVHGKMKAIQKQEVMDRYAKAETQILVATTVIEVGINVPNSTIILIENAERFGLAQLHQLRGRVGRGKEKSYCILVTDSRSRLTKERMKIMQQTNDGFRLSEVDLDLRGPGDFFGTRQHGLPEMKIANLYKDMEIVKEAQEAAKKLIERDFMLEKEENQKLKVKLSEFFKDADNMCTML